MPLRLYSKISLRKNIVSFFIGTIIIWLFFWVVYSTANSIGAIVISGTHHQSFGRDVSNMVTALSNTSVGYGITNIYTGTNQSFTDFQAAITQMNNSGVSELHVYISSHGGKNTIRFSDQSVSKSNFISAINSSNASTKHVVLDSCYSGTFYNDLSAVVGQDGSVITSTDSDHVARSLWTSWFTSALTDAMQNSDSDQNDDGKVDYGEALNWLKANGGWLPNIGNPKSSNDAIPTLSEWGQIILVLSMLSLVLGFTNQRNANTNDKYLNLPFGKDNFIIFDQRIYKKVIIWVVFVVVVGLIITTILLEHIKILDIIGALFCVPLISYILHIISIYSDIKSSKLLSATNTDLVNY